MIRDTPCHFFTKYLLSNPAGYSNDAVRKKLQKLHLDYIGVDHLDELRESMVVPEPFYPNETTHTASWRFLLEQKIYRLYHRDEATTNAFLILKTPRAKEMVETFLLSGVPHDKIASQITMKLKTAFSSAGVERYYFYFWNLEKVDSMEMRAILDLRYDSGMRQVGMVELPDDLPGEEKMIRLTSMVERTQTLGTMQKTAKRKDPRQQALSLPASAAAALLAQARLGTMPKRDEIARVLELARDVAALRVIENAFEGQGYNALQAMQWSATVKATSDVLETMQKPDDNMFEHLRKVKLQTKEFQTPLLGHDGNDYSRGYALADRASEEQHYKGKKPLIVEAEGEDTSGEEKRPRKGT